MGSDIKLQDSRCLEVTWSSFDKLTQKLANNIQKEGIGKYQGILAVGRGGLIVGTYLSHLLNLPLKVLMAKYDKDMLKFSNYISSIEDEWTLSNSTHILIVDEIIDKGNTIDKVIELCRYHNFEPISYIYDVASLFVNTANCPKHRYPKFSVEKTDKWVKFPWEVK